MTQQRIVDVLRGRGCKVLSLAAMGNGCADLIVYVPRDASLYFIEVKNLDGRGKKLTPEQERFHSEWPVTVVTSPEEALRAVGLC